MRREGVCGGRGGVWHVVNPVTHSLNTLHTPTLRHFPHEPQGQDMLLFLFFLPKAMQLITQARGQEDTALFTIFCYSV